MNRVHAFAIAVSLAAVAGNVAAAGLQEQIDSAQPGDTILVASGSYPGPLVIRKPIVLEGKGLPLIRGNGHGKVIEISADDVVIRGFRISGSGLNLSEDEAAIHVTGNRVLIENNEISDSLHGIYLRRTQDSRVLNNRILGKASVPVDTGSVEEGLGKGSSENCDTATLIEGQRGNGIHQWNCERTQIIGNEISETRDGVYFSFANHGYIARNYVHNVRYGLHYMYSDDNTFEENTFSENAAGAAVMFSERVTIRDNRFLDNRGSRAYGIILQSTDQSNITGNEFERNAVGLSFNQCNRNRITGNKVSNNYIGMKFSSNSDENSFSENRFLRNLHPVEVAGIGTGNSWSIAGVGNHWDSASGFDLNSDGIEDMPHRELDLFGPYRRHFPAIALLSGSPGAQALRFAHGRVAIPGINAIEDRAPLLPTYKPALPRIARSRPAAAPPTGISPGL